MSQPNGMPPGAAAPQDVQVSVRFGALTEEERTAMSAAGQGTEDILAMYISAFGPAKIAAGPDGTILLTTTFAIPPGMFEFQKTSGLVAANGQPMIDLASGFASIPFLKVLIKRSGLATAYRDLPIVKAVTETAAALAALPPLPFFKRSE